MFRKQPPKIIKVMGIRVAVDYSNDHIIADTDKGADRSLAGLWQGDMAQIMIAKHQGIENKRETLLHETLHAIMTQMGLKAMLDRCKDPAGACDHERIVEGLSVGLMAVLRDNPKLVAYILDETL